MTPTHSPNAVELVFSHLAQRIQSFAAQVKAYLLIWPVDAAGGRTIDTFVSVQGEEAAADLDGIYLPHLFIPLEAFCETADAFGIALVEGLKQDYEETQDAVKAAGVRAGWKCPPRPARGSAVQWLAEACGSLATHYEPELAAGDQPGDPPEKRLLIFVLRPQEPASDKIAAAASAWSEVLSALVGEKLPPRVRFLAVDLMAPPQLKELAAKSGGRVIHEDPHIDMAEIVRSLAQNSGGNGSGFQLRTLLVELAQAAEEGGLQAGPARDRFLDTAAKALGIAVEQKWLHQQVVVHMLVAGSLLGAGDVEGSARRYQEAGKAADATVAGNDATGYKLRLHALLGEASARYQGKDLGAAAKVYDAAAEAAKSCEGKGLPSEELEGINVLRLEALRMRAHCLAKSGELEEAWRAGWLAVDDVATRLSPEMRKASTLPYVGRDLLELTRAPARGGVLSRLVRGAPFEDKEPRVRARMVDLLGEGWESALASP